MELDNLEKKSTNARLAVEVESLQNKKHSKLSLTRAPLMAENIRSMVKELRFLAKLLATS